MNIKKIVYIVLTLLMPLLATAQPYWNKLDVYRVNKLTAHDRVIPDGSWR